MDSSSSSGEETIMAALINLDPDHFAHLTRSLASDLHLQHCRLAFLLLSPLHFSHTLSHLHFLSLSQKTLLLARLLLRSLSKLLCSPTTSSSSCFDLRPRDFDAALLLMTMCEVYDRNDHQSSSCGLGFDWRLRIAEVACTLCPAELGAQGWGVVARYVDAATKCRRLLDAVSGGRASREQKAGTEAAAAVAAVVALPSVECEREGWECAVCKEEMEVGRDVCALPCDHGFHWGCILPWLRKRNTCPCCRFELPTDDVFAEIERVWRSAVRMGSTRS